MSTPIFNTPESIRTYLAAHRRSRVGFVPTMGALHIGHRSLIDRSKSENDITIVSIFVNPLQFGAGEDLDRYPRQLEIDRQFCAELGVDAIFAPLPDTIGTHPNITTILPPAAMISGLCGRTRVGHFQGVATIVGKLFNIIQPDRAYFGEKDAQQLAIIRRLSKDLNYPIEIIGCPTVRETSGLAYSSRNQYLTPAERDRAAVIYRALQRGKSIFDGGNRQATDILAAVTNELSTVPELAIEYVELVDANDLQPLTTVDRSALLAIAAKIGTTRLIDNITLLT
jgi:pantoate ligase / CMP/dCMP kinase